MPKKIDLRDKVWTQGESYKIMDKMVTELSLYMSPFELDRCMDFLWTCEQGNFDTNLSVTDCATQLKLILGSERYFEIQETWSQKNQKILSVYGKLKYKCKKTSKVYDGLDAEDKETDYEKIYV